MPIGIKAGIFMKKLLSMLAITALSAMMFVGCGSTADSANKTDNSKSSVEGTAMDTPVDIGLFQLTDQTSSS